MPAVLGAWALAIATIDLWRLRVPNWLLLLVAVPAVLAQIVNGHGLLGQDHVQSLLGAVAAFGLLIVGYALGTVGAGDVKYATVIGFLVGGATVLKILLLSALVLGALSLLALAEAKIRIRPARRLPAAVALSAGFAIALMGTRGYGN